MPWKFLFAIVPPVDFMDGWPTFFSALVMIGGVIALISDLASALGCCLGIPDGITAITFVALGTSLPDTFASKTAAVSDPYADASIGNITGSNSVNVFLGLGLPWVIGSIYWVVNGPRQDWLDKYPEQAAAYPGGIFVVPAGSLSFNLTVFTCCAVVCIGFLALRRNIFGGELGGPVLPKSLSAAFCVTLWLIYVGLSS